MGTREFWSGEFGDAYTSRNGGAGLLATNVNLFSKILARTHDVETIIELGANKGMNLDALKILLPTADLTGVDINESAVTELTDKGYVGVQSALQDYTPVWIRDMVISKGVGIHIPPDELEAFYAKLYECSKRYIVIAEYYSKAPREIEYRGNIGKLWARDFAGDMLNLYPDLQLVDYGFQYHRDANFPSDDITWAVLEKKVAL